MLWICPIVSFPNTSNKPEALFFSIFLPILSTTTPKKRQRECMCEANIWYLISLPRHRAASFPPECKNVSTSVAKSGKHYRVARHGYCFSRVCFPPPGFHFNSDRLSSRDLVHACRNIIFDSRLHHSAQAVHVIALRLASLFPRCPWQRLEDVSGGVVGDFFFFLHFALLLSNHTQTPQAQLYPALRPMRAILPCWGTSCSYDLVIPVSPKK